MTTYSTYISFDLKTTETKQVTYVNKHIMEKYSIRGFDISLNLYQTNHAIGCNRSRDLLQPIAWFVWYKFNAMSKHLIGKKENSI